MTTLERKLIEGINYYVNNPSRRCISTSGQCYYSGKTAGVKSKGCFIGRFLSPKDRIKADNGLTCDTAVRNLIKYSNKLDIKIPNWILTAPIMLLAKFQNWHDRKDNWSDNALTDLGNDRLHEILNMYQHIVDKETILSKINLPK